MSLKYSLSENLLTTRAGDYTAHPQDVKSHDLESVVDRMDNRGNTKNNIIANLKSFFDEVNKITEAGEAINIDFINTHFSIQGVFNGADDTFDPKRHTLKLNVSASKSFKKSLEAITLEKTTVNQVSVNILEVKDSVTGSINQNISSQGVVEIVGDMIKVAGSDASNGVYFVATDGTANKVATLVENKPSKLIVIVPTLTAGTYKLQITTQYNGSSILNLPRTGVFSSPLTVS